MKLLKEQKRIREYWEKISNYTIEDTIKFLSIKIKKNKKIFNYLYILIFLTSLYCLLPSFESNRKRVKQYFLSGKDYINLGIKINNNSKIARIGEKISVKIEGSSKGSGVLIGREGQRYFVLTAGHVVKDDKTHENVEITTYDGSNHLWESMNTEKLETVDLAIITFKSDKFYQTANLGKIKDILIGNDIYVSGFPIETSTIPERLIRITKGEVLGNTSLQIPDGYQLHHDAPTLVGMSGGGVLNTKGELIGIHGRTERKDSYFDFYGKDKSTGVNLAIPIIHLKNHLSIKNSEKHDKKIPIEKEIIPLNESDYNSKALIFLEIEGSEQEAINLAKLALGIEINPESYFLISQAEAKLNNWDKSLEYILKAIEIDSKNQSYFQHLGNIKLNLKDYVGARNAFSKAITIDPKNSNLYFQRGNASEYLNNHEDALKDFNEAIKIDPKNSELLNARAYLKSNLGDYQGAIKDLRKDMSLFGIDPWYWYQRGIYNEKLGDSKSAKKDFYRAIVVTNAFIFFTGEEYSDFLYQFRAELKYSLKDFEGAIEDIKKAIYFNPQDTSNYFVISNYQYELGDYREAIQNINKVINLRPNNSFGFFIRGNSFYKLKDFFAAKEDFDKAIEINGKDPKYFRSRAYANYALKELKNSCADYEKSIKMSYRPAEFAITKISQQPFIWCENIFK